MSIPIAHEDREDLARWDMGLASIIEDCAFCRSPTRYWHTRTNNPVCPDCAKQHRVAELRNWRKAR